MDFKLSDGFIEQYKEKVPNWGPLGEFVYLRTYSRKIEEENRNESWWETVRRVVEGAYNIQKEHCNGLRLPWNNTKAQKSAQIMYEKIFNFKFLPPGRGLWMMGTPFVKEKGSASMTNCSFISSEDIETKGSFIFTWIMDALMLGVGAGLDTKGANKITIKSPKEGGVFIIPDSREGWVESLGILLDAYFHGKALPTFDYSQIRPYGMPIRGFGGTASGPAPLKEMHESISKLLAAKIGKKLSSVDIVDIENLISVCVIAGNVRRGAAIVVGYPDDKEYVTMKDYTLHPEELKSHRWSSNNSVFAEVGKTDYSQFIDSLALNGEPGIVWLENMQKYSRTIDPPDWKDYDVKGPNACFAEGTLVHTKEGHFPIETLVGKTVEIHDGDKWVEIDNFRVTGENQEMLNIELHDGTILTVTPYHTFIKENGVKVEAKDLKITDRLMISTAEQTHGQIKAKAAYLKGFLTGDGSIDPHGNPILYLYEPKYMCGERLLKSASELPLGEVRTNAISELFFADNTTTCRNKTHTRKIMRGLAVRKEELIGYGCEYKKYIPTEVFSWDHDSKCSFIAGVLDADGTASDTKNGWMYQIMSIHENWLKDFQLLLKTIGVFSKVVKVCDGGTVDFNDGYGEYPTQPCYRMTISQESSIRLAQQVKFSRLTSFADKRTTYKVKPRWNAIVSIEPAGTHEKVYCCTVPTNHTFSLTCGLRTGQCGEISLCSTEICNLVETFPSLHSSYDEYKETLKYAYLYAKTVTLLPTHWPETNAIILKNRRIGLSQSGIIDAFGRHGRRKILEWCREGYEYVQKMDKIYSDWLCIPRSRKITTVKPSGTVALLPGVSAGIHYPHAEYYIRRVRIAASSPLMQIMYLAGYVIEDDANGDPNTKVVVFPVHEKYFSKRKEDVSMWEQVKNVVDYQRFWADNNVSVTVTFKKNEKEDIVRVLECYEDSLKTISFLPLTDHNYAQAPYEEITKERYEELASRITTPDFSSMVSVPLGSKFCDGESCSLG